MIPTKGVAHDKSSPAEYTLAPEQCFHSTKACYVSLQAVTVHLQQNISQQSSPPPQQQYPDLKLGQIVHRRKPTSFISPARDFDGLQILLTRSPGNYQILSNRI